MKSLLVDARQAKHVPGRKSDVQDCQWLQQLHTYGLLRAAFRPEDSICRLRTLQRHRKNLVESAAMWIQHMQKALNEMNLHLHHVLSDISGHSGLAILDAILDHSSHRMALRASIVLSCARIDPRPARLGARVAGPFCAGAGTAGARGAGGRRGSRGARGGAGGSAVARAWRKALSNPSSERGMNRSSDS